MIDNIKCGICNNKLLGCGYSYFNMNHLTCKEHCTHIIVSKNEINFYRFFIPSRISLEGEYMIYSSIIEANIFLVGNFPTKKIYHSNNIIHFPIENDLLQVMPFLNKILKLKSFL